MAEYPGDGLPDWRARYDAVRALGVPLDPRSEEVPGVTAYPTSYAPDHLLITRADDLDELFGVLEEAATQFAWRIELQNIDGSPLEIPDAVAREARNREAFDVPTIHRVKITSVPNRDGAATPDPPVEAWRLLQRARMLRGRFGRLDPYERARKELFAEGISSSKIYLDPLRPSVEDLVDMITSGVRSSFTYAGASTVAEFHERATVGLQSAAGYEEGKALPVSW